MIAYVVKITSSVAWPLVGKLHKLFQLKMVLQTVSVRAVEVAGDDYPTVGQLSFCCQSGLIRP